MASAWWSAGLSGAFTGSLDFLPGGSYQTNSGGMTQTETYTSANLDTVGTLYQTIYGLGLAALVIAAVGAIFAFLGATGKVRDARTHNVVRGFAIFTFSAMLVAVLVAPLVQPYAFSSAPVVNCTGSTGPNPCHSFWGSSSNASESVGWGANVGWYLGLGALVLTLLSLVLWSRSARDPWAPDKELGTPDLSKLVQLKGLLDSGAISQEEYQTAKGRILGPGVSEPPARESAPSTSDPSAELARLKQMKETSALTQEEYDALRARVLARL